MNYIIYKTTNKINKKYYIGVHKQEGIDFDGYLGSGKVLKNSVQKYGKENFIRETLYCFDNKECAYLKEKSIVDLDEVNNRNCYNQKEGGIGGTTHNDMSWVWTEESVAKANKTKIERYGSITGQLTTKEVQDKRNKKSLETYGVIAGQILTKESRTKAKETSIKNWGSNQGHLRSKTSLDNRKSSNYKKYYSENLYLHIPCMLVTSEGEVVFRGDLYQLSRFINGDRRAFSYSYRVLNRLKTGSKFNKGHKFPYHKIVQDYFIYV